MPYLSFDLDALARVPRAASLAGAEPEVIAYGLLQLWEHAWREKAAEVSAAMLRSCFRRADPTLLEEALITFKFVERLPSGAFRVKGADRYLRISLARSAGGKAASGNLKRGSTASRDSAGGSAGEQPGTTPGSPPAHSRLKPGTTPGSSSALTASSEQRTANLFAGSAEADPPKKPAKAPPDPRHAPMVKALVAAAPGYGFTPRCAKAVSELLRLGSDAEILDRWRRALGRSDFPKVRMLSELVTHWGHFAPESTSQPQQEALTVWR